MRSDIIISGPFKGKRIEIAPSDGIEMFADIADDFLYRIFSIRGALITDESSLSDFLPFPFDGNKKKQADEMAETYNKIQKIFGVDVAGIKSGNLLRIFMIIHEKRRGQ